MARMSDLATPPARIGAVLLGAAGVLHLALSPEYLEEAPVIGVLFLLSLPATIVPAVLIWLTDALSGLSSC
jgi:hypothetical protein